MSKYYRINQYIQAKEVRVIDETGKQVGILPIFNALQKARELEVDLIEVSGNANPPVCKLINFKKFKYLEDKKEREEKKGQKGGELKEIRLTPFIASGDIETRLKRIREFLSEGNKVKLAVRFRGREMSRKEFGYRVIKQVVEGVAEFGTLETEPKMQGKDLFAILTPIKKKS